MKMYFFSNRGYGACYTIMAESRENAKKVLGELLDKRAIDEEERVKKAWARNRNFNSILKNTQESLIREKDIDYVFDIKEYGENEVIETAYE